MQTRSRLLAIIDDDAVYDRILPLCDRSSLQVTRVSESVGAPLLLHNRHYDLVIVCHPMPGIRVDQLLAALRQPGSPSIDTPVLVLTPETEIDRLMQRVDEREVQVLSIDITTSELQKSVSEILGVATRCETRLLIQFEVLVGQGHVARVCQAKNISETGALLHTSRKVPVGTLLPISFTLADDPRPIHGTARVVRHTEPLSEDLPGMGVNFVRLDTEARERMREFMAESRRDDAKSTRHPAAMAIN